MKIEYEGKRPESYYLDGNPIPLTCAVVPRHGSLLVEGDNLEVMLSLLTNYQYGGTVDLVYIDPPFATNSVFRSGVERTATVSSHHTDRIAYEDKLLGADFLEFLRGRLIVIRELMSDRASIYLHIDYKIGHYVKIIMDEVFGIENFRNDIARVKCNPKNFSRKAYGNVKDLVLFYSKTSRYTWNEPTEALAESDLERLYPRTDKNGRRYATVPVHAPGVTQNGPTGSMWRGLMPPKGRHWRSSPEELDRLDRDGLIEWSSNGNPRRVIFADDAARRGKKIQDVWMDFKDHPYPGYPTEKNFELLRTIVRASSNPGDVVLDCFCGSGTTLAAAESLNRRWIGIDESSVAIEATVSKLSSGLLLNENYQVARLQAEAVPSIAM